MYDLIDETDAVENPAMRDSHGHDAFTQLFDSLPDATALNRPDVKLNIRWVERNIAIDQANPLKGFRHSVLTDLTRQSLNAEVDYDLGPDGVAWNAKVPSQFFSARGSDACRP